MAEDYVTVTHLAARLGCNRSAVQKRARRLGAKMVGKMYLLTPAQAAEIAADLRRPGKPGRKLSAQIVGGSHEPLQR